MATAVDLAAIETLSREPPSSMVLERRGIQ